MPYPNGAGQVLPNKIPGSEWLIQSVPALGAQAQVTKAAAGARVRNVVTLLIATLIPGSASVGYNSSDVQLLDNGASVLDFAFLIGGTTTAFPPIVINLDPVYKGGLNTPLVFQFPVAMANIYQRVVMGGYQVIE